MVPVSLGLLDGIKEMLKLIFNEIFVPVLKDVFNIVFYMIKDLLGEFFGALLLQLWVALLKLVNFLESIFNIFSGYSQIEVNNVSDNQSILTYLFGLPVVQRGMLIITAVSFVLAMVTTGIAVIQSIGDSIADNKRPISVVLREALKTAVTFMLVPFACLFAVEAVTQILVQIQHALVIGSSSASLGGTIFVTIAQDHFTGDGNSKHTLEFFSIKSNFQNLNTVQDCFEYRKFDFLIAIIVSIFLMLIMVTTIIQFIQRLFMILLLYIVSPIFAAYMPIDGGKSFKQWKDAFVAFLISAFSPIVAMRLYMGTLPILLGGKIDFGNNVEPMLMKLLLVLGGSFAIYTSRNMLVKLYNPSLGEQLDANSFLVNMVAGSVVGRIQRAISQPKGKGGQGGQQQQQQQQQQQEEKQDSGNKGGSASSGAGGAASKAASAAASKG